MIIFHSISLLCLVAKFFVNFYHSIKFLSLNVSSLESTLLFSEIYHEVSNILHITKCMAQVQSSVCLNYFMIRYCLSFYPSNFFITSTPSPLSGIFRCLATFYFHMQCKISLSSSVKNLNWIFIGIALILQLSLRNSGILMMENSSFQNIVNVAIYLLCLMFSVKYLSFFYKGVFYILFLLIL